MVAAVAARYTRAVDIPRAAEPLYALPPSRFTAERTALARTLADKRDPAAAAVRKLPRPVGLAWVLNRLAREQPREVEALVAAGDRLRAGQRRALSGAGADELRAAENDIRARARVLRTEGERILAAEGRPAPPPALARLELLLRVAAPVPGPARDALRRGVLLREPEIAPGELTGFAVLPGGRGTSRGAGSERHAPRVRQAAREAPLARGRREEEREARKREARERRERDRATAAARREAAAARARAEREERMAAEAAERARSARERAAAARAEAERLAARLRAVERRSGWRDPDAR
jgi:hypothetical protein